MNKIIVPCTGKCGSRYLMFLFQELNIKTHHESIFTPLNKDLVNEDSFEWPNYLTCETSYLSTLYLDRLKNMFPEIKILHLYRHPYKVINSWLRKNDPINPKDDCFPLMRLKSPIMRQYMENNKNPLDIICFMYCYFNEIIIKNKPTATLKLEDLSVKLIKEVLERLLIPKDEKAISKAINTLDKNINSMGDKSNDRKLKLNDFSKDNQEYLKSICKILDYKL